MDAPPLLADSCSGFLGSDAASSYLITMIYGVQRQIEGDCVDMEPDTEQRGDVIVSLLMILKKARQQQLGPSLRDVLHPAQNDVCKYVGYRSVIRYPHHHGQQYSAERGFSRRTAEFAICRGKTRNCPFFCYIYI